MDFAAGTYNSLRCIVVLTMLAGCQSPAESTHEQDIARQLTSSDVEERRVAAAMCADMPEIPGLLVPVLTSSLADEDSQVRLLAAQAMRGAGQRGLMELEQLNKYLRDPAVDSPTKAAIQEAIDEILRSNDPNAPPAN